jgi:hypothetical protein
VIERLATILCRFERNRQLLFGFLLADKLLQSSRAQL